MEFEDYEVPKRNLSIVECLYEIKKAKTTEELMMLTEAYDRMTGERYGDCPAFYEILLKRAVEIGEENERSKGWIL